MKNGEVQDLFFGYKTDYEKEKNSRTVKEKKYENQLKKNKLFWVKRKRYYSTKKYFYLKKSLEERLRNSNQ